MEEGLVAMESAEHNQERDIRNFPSALLLTQGLHHLIQPFLKLRFGDGVLSCKFNDLVHGVVSNVFTPIQGVLPVDRLAKNFVRSNVFEDVAECFLACLPRATGFFLCSYEKGHQLRAIRLVYARHCEGLCHNGRLIEFKCVTKVEVRVPDA